jgi:predicted ArsR family transcriptional regulator
MEEKKIRLLQQEIESLKKSVQDLHLMHTQQKIALLNAFKKRYGSEVFDIIEKANGEATRKAYTKNTEGNNKHSIEDLITMLWEPLRKQGLEFSMEHVDNGIQMKCTKCPVADLYKQVGGTEWGYHLYCAADKHIVEAFNPNIGFRRSKTLMEGHECCDHFYFWKAGEKKQ